MTQLNVNASTQQLQSSRSRNDSYSSFQSVINQLNAEQSKFCSIFIENWEVFQAHVTSCQVMHTPHIFGSRFVTYKIRVLTDHVSYFVNKRYRDFLDLYNKVSQYYQPKTLFPRKTHLRSKICPFLTEGRRKAFDGLISEIISMRNSNKSVISQLIMFLDVKSHYNSMEIDKNIYLADRFSDYMKERSYLYGHFLRHEMIKMHIKPNQSLRYLQKIEFLLNSASRTSIKMDDLKAVLIGWNKIPGLIETATSNNNEIVSLTFLKSIKKLLDIETCPYAQPFKKIFQSAPTRILFVPELQMLSHEQFANSYFELIQLYIKLKTSTEAHLKIDDFIKQLLSDQVIQNFKQWKNGRKNIQTLKKRQTKLEMGILKLVNQENGKMEEEVSNNQIQQQDQEIMQAKQIFAKQLEAIENREGPNLQKYKQLHKLGSSYCQVSNDKRFLHFVIYSTEQFKQIYEIVKKWKHNGLASSYSTQALTNISKIFFVFEGKSQKLFQFQQRTSSNTEQIIQGQTNHTKNQVQITLETPDQIKNANSFFYRAKITQKQDECKIDILYHFYNKKIRKFFENECTGKSEVMWNSLCQKLVTQQEKISHGSPAKTSETL